jgi:hypothetical protein
MGNIPAVHKRKYSPVLTAMHVESIETGVSSTPFSKFEIVRESVTDSYVNSVLFNLPDTPAVVEAKSFAPQIDSNQTRIFVVGIVLVILTIATAGLGLIPLIAWWVWQSRKEKRINALKMRRDWLLSHQMNNLGFKTLGSSVVGGQCPENVDSRGYTPPIPAHYQMPDANRPQVVAALEQITGQTVNLSSIDGANVVHEISSESAPIPPMYEHTPASSAPEFASPINQNIPSSSTGVMDWNAEALAMTVAAQTENWPDALNRTNAILSRRHELVGTENEWIIGTALMLNGTALFKAERYAESIATLEESISFKKVAGEDYSTESQLILIARSLS